MTRRLHIAALLTCALLLPPGADAFAQPRAAARRRPAAARRAGGPRVVAANVLEAMYFKERAESDITPAALAAYGNSLVARRGLDFMFDACAVMGADRNPRPVPAVSDSAKAFDYGLRRVGGRMINFQLIADVFGEVSDGACGECFFEVPALRVTKTEMLVVAGGRRYLLERPPGFLLQEAGLVGGSGREVRRRWQLPFQTVPLGLSPDRTKLYVPLPDFDGETWDDKLALELSDAGVRFVARAGLSLPTHESLTDAPNAEGVSLIRYGKGPRSYVLRLADPCA